jgi:hypothetical protein
MEWNGMEWNGRMNGRRYHSDVMPFWRCRKSTAMLPLCLRAYRTVSLRQANLGLRID